MKTLSLCARSLLACIGVCVLLISPTCSSGDEEEDYGRIRGANGTLSLAIAVALTSEGESKLDPGWGQMAASLMAVDHFNERNPVVVQQLAELQDCPFRFTEVSAIDTGTNSHMAMKSLLQRVQEKGPVDAIAGPYNEMPALELSVMATGMESPMVSFRGLDHSLILPDKHPFYSQVNPDLYAEMEFIAEYLKYVNRTDYIAIIYSNDDSVLQRMETLRSVLKEKLDSNHTKAYSYLATSKAQEGEDRGLRDAAIRVAKTGYRTIILLTTTPHLDTPDLGATAHEYRLDRGKHFWIIPGGIDNTNSDRDNILIQYRDKKEGGFLKGAAYSMLWEAHNVRQVDQFNLTLAVQNASFVQRLRDLNPIANYTGKYFCRLNEAESIDRTYNPQCQVPDDFFLGYPHMAERVGFAYDATMSIGIGACLAIANKTNTTAMTGKEHLDGIQKVDFRGASGHVKFQNRPGTPGSRASGSIFFGIMNLLPYGADSDVYVHPSAFMDPDLNGSWVQMAPFVYRDGTNNPPARLRSVPEQNYLDPVVRGIGLSLMSMALIFIFASLVWVWLNRSHRVVIAAQPPFLYVLCLGSTLVSLVILVSSFDESYGFDEAMLSTACVAVPWLYVLGDMIVYSALFTKLWRVNKVLQFKRRQIEVRHVVWPSFFLIISAIFILAVWTAVDDYRWVREEIDEVSGETIGKCTGTHTGAFFLPVGIICSIPTLLTCMMAWKTRDVDDIYSEAKWIFSLVLVQIQVIVVGVPVVIILQNVDTSGRFIGLSLIVWTFPMSTMGLIMGPKMYALRRERFGLQHTSTRGSSSGVHISGVSLPQEQSQAARSSGNTAAGQSPGENHAMLANPSPFNVSSSRVQTVTMH